MNKPGGARGVGMRLVRVWPARLLYIFLWEHTSRLFLDTMHMHDMRYVDFGHTIVVSRARLPRESLAR